MADCEHGRIRSRTLADPVVDAGEVVLHGSGREEEHGADLAVGEPANHQAQQIDLAIAPRIEYLPVHNYFTA